MAPQTLPGRVASPSPPIPARSPRLWLWPNLPAEAQMQIAQIIAALMRRMQAIHGTRGREITRADRLKRR
jgi:hypothetical protein